ncbi:hypothetical protein CspHIS471_0209370 [Cutaneotrichosporon sp. HIS471]|nr:hypothetical protein CspHIS471_0209370 [Cutaneotrichosporon sp. HIS471]
MSAPPPDKSVEGISTPIAEVHSRTTSPNISASSTTATLAAAHPHPSSLPDHTSSPTSTPVPVRTASPGLASSPNLMPLSSTPLSSPRPGSGPSSPTHGERHTLPSWLWHTTHTTSYTSDKAGTRRRDTVIGHQIHLLHALETSK